MAVINPAEQLCNALGFKPPSHIGYHFPTEELNRAGLYFQNKLQDILRALVEEPDENFYILVRGPWDEDNTAFVQEATEAIEYLTERTNLDVEMDIWKPGLFDDDDDEYDDDE